MNVLLTGMSGLLGKYLYMTRPDVDVWGTYHLHPIDYPQTVKMSLTKPEDIVYAFNRSQPDVVIHCASEGSVDYCERNSEAARCVIVDSMDWVIRCANEHDALLVCISTNAVFDGGHAPCSEKDVKLPVNCYGAMKAVAEDFVMNDAKKYLIVRPILLYGWTWPWGRENWMTTIWEGRNTDKTWCIVADRITQPTSAKVCAETIWTLIEKEQTGIFHVGGADVLPLYNFCRTVARISGMDVHRIEPALSSDFPQLARRPIDTHYDLSKIRALGIEPVGIEDGLRYYLGPEVIHVV